MSTFNGIVSEFPDIRIDFFRNHPDAQPPLACFLSHVHSDHLAGLESFRSPFVYCSAATKEILLRLERYPCRINYANGILEARQQTYKQLAKVLKPLPLETPVMIELRPGQEIQVTLFDANHCPGAVMFLIEGDGKAALYTGDIRSEPWFVNSIARSPILVQYTSGIKTLDKIYLDTSFIEDIPFQTKAQGIAELIKKVLKYPADTVFHFQAWTYGYEDVWVALSKALKSPIHVDDYKLRIYGSLKARSSEARFSSDYHLTPESPALTGYMCGNTPKPGCLTSDDSVRLHSCEKGNMCEMAKRSTTVSIQPIVAHLPNGQDLAEVGVGGGGDDLQREAELDYLDQAGLEALLEMLWSSESMPEEARNSLVELWTRASSTGRTVHLDHGISSVDDKISVTDMVTRIVKKLEEGNRPTRNHEQEQAELPKLIQFPYSRHSSYPELCQLVDLFQPKDVWPCTVDPVGWLNNGTSIASLFGEFCSGNEFAHDAKMQEFAEQQMPMKMAAGDSQATTASVPISSSPPAAPSIEPHESNPRPIASPSLSTHNPKKFVTPLVETQSTSREDTPIAADADVVAADVLPAVPSEMPASLNKRSFDSSAEADHIQSDPSRRTPEQANSSFCSAISEHHSTARQEAYFQMLNNLESDEWRPIFLISTNDEHTTVDQEL
ncbi:hypothetical protein B0T10DRAFT_144375 [Thelonectria olida]|uniref:Protein artemis n=1 Tax=Thelonectria olida TaxID=1576542 RepID=A0A9P8VV51_9HYPO|nr:hypothetical protein B0T10DRAFT_144375 [Thelonectria olida]